LEDEEQIGPSKKEGERQPDKRLTLENDFTVPELLLIRSRNLSQWLHILFVAGSISGYTS
jgi:hypothetical protein